MFLKIYHQLIGRLHEIDHRDLTENLANLISERLSIATVDLKLKFLFRVIACP